MKGNGRDAAGCSLAFGGAGAGLALWSVDVRRRFYRFEDFADWSVLYAELPLAVLGGTAGGLLLWAAVLRLRKRAPGRRPGAARFRSRRPGPPTP